MFTTKLRYTSQEIKQVKKLNEGHFTWLRVTVTTTLALLPSIGMVLLTGNSFLMICAATLIGGFWLFLLFMLLRGNAEADKKEFTITFSPLGKRESWDNSVAEHKWCRYRSFQEHPNHFLMQDEMHHWLVPKRIIPSENLAEFMTYTEKIGQPENNDEPVLPLYQRLRSLDASEIHELKYLTSDLTSLTNDWKDINKKVEPRKSGWSLFYFVVIFACALIWFYFGSFDDGPPAAEPIIFRSTTEVIIVIAAVILPFVLFVFIMKYYNWIWKPDTGKVPKDPSEFALLPEGWLVGNRKTMAFHNWRDITNIYESTTSYGFKTTQEMLIFVPKRIFADQEKQTQFIDRAAELHRLYNNQFVDAVEVEETGNPYQAPIK